MARPAWEGQAFMRPYSKVGIEYGEYFQGVQALWGTDQESLGLVQLPESYKKELVRLSSASYADGCCLSMH